MTATLLLTGARGQLGSTFRQHWHECALADRYQLVAMDRNRLDLTRRQSLLDWLDGQRPEIIVNTAAYTAVDRAEQEAALAYRVNTEAVRDLATWCRAHEAVLVHLSTDFVFDGHRHTPYPEEAATNPLGVYGKSKRAGERHLQSLLPDSSIILRTSWLYSEHGTNFVKTMLRLMGERDSLGIVDDQLGSPTSAHSLVKLMFRVIEAGCCGILHWSDGGTISRYDLAVATQQAGMESGLLDRSIPLYRLSTGQYPTAAPRPAYSVLDRSAALPWLGERPGRWQQELAHVVATLARTADGSSSLVPGNGNRE